ncbi:MAG: acyl-CoA dehydrogenase family protein [Pseudomonadales bacterium]|nr:acyl-CoA dehydrogenase family protein [Pseudomonadales bacterium]
MNWLDYLFEQASAGNFEYVTGDARAGDATQDLDLFQWYALCKEGSSNWSAPVERAVIDGYFSASVGYVFASGYQWTLRALLLGKSLSGKQKSATLQPIVDPEAIVSFCVTESGGNRPSAVKSSLEKKGNQFVLNGEKTFITGAKEAEKLLVAASIGEKDGRNQLKLAVVDAKQQGVEIQIKPAMSFLPIVSHGSATFDNVMIDESNVLEGDAYTDYVKPLRTIEDIYVFATLFGYLFKISRQYQFPQEITQDIVQVLLVYVQLASMDPLSPSAHIALGGAENMAEAVVATMKPYWEKLPEDLQAHWLRDKALMGIATTAKVKRLETAWQHLG